MLFRSRVFRAAVGLVGWALLCCYAQRAGAVEITEFLADNASGLTDEDGDFSDWIEVANPDPITADLSGWRLTDESDKPSKWRFPPGITLAGGERLLVFASGKNRTQPGAPLHTSFSLKREGEYLALLPPSGSTPTTEFRPAYPAQLPDVSYGIGIRPLPQALVGTESVSRLRIPSSTDIDRRWIGAPGNEPYPDAAWTVGTPQVGYDDLSTDVGRILLGYWTFDDAARPRVAVDSSGRNHSGSLLGPAVLASGGSGHTGRAGDRALDLGAGNNGSAVRVDAAAAGGFDQIAALDQVTISLWAFGGPQLPSMNSVFWFDSGGTSGDNRNIMVHLPWSDSVIYFDTAGCCGAETRIARQETDTSRWRGKWNHYVFVKDHGRKEIWQNGVLWHSGTGAQPLKAIKALWLGSAGNATISYPGKLDDVAVWAGALTASEIQSLTAGLSPLAVGTYRSLIRTDLQPTLRGLSTKAWLRLPFDWSANSPADLLLFTLNYDDGFTAWLNGVEAAVRNVPVLRSRSKAEGLAPLTLQLRASAAGVREGPNVLALEGVNDQVNGSDFLLAVALRAGMTLPGRYFVKPSPRQINDAGVAGLTADPEFSPGRGFYDQPVTVTLSCATPGARIFYTLDGSLPDPANGRTVEPVDSSSVSKVSWVVSNSVVIRAIALRDDFAPSGVQTHTFLFPSLVQNQPSRIPGYPATWGVYGAYGPIPGQPVPADYAMDPRVTQTTTPGYSVREALVALPAVCLTTTVSNLFDAATGIYPNSAAQGAQWVRPASAELIFPDGRPGFQIDAGLRIHGGLSRQHWHARKHSFRLSFTSEYGPTRLRYRLFDDSRVTSFNELTLRASSTDGWSVEDADPWTRPKATYMRDPWMKDTQQSMGWPCGHSRYVHLFLNGLYWGQYNLAERTEAVWLAENFGGASEDFDIIKDVGELENGDRKMWDAMITLAAGGLSSDIGYWRLQGRRADGSRDPTLPVYLDVDNLIDYMILHIYSGAIDWPNHNWWGARRRTEPSEGFRFFTWDQEISNISLSVTTTYTGEPFAEVSGPIDSPAFLYAKLRANARFRARFAARVVALTTGFGLLTPSQNAARWERRQVEIDQSIVAESARWGDSRAALPLKRSDWLTEMNWMRTTYWPRNHDIAVGRFRSVGLYTTSALPTVVISPVGGILNPGGRVALSGGTGIYYTTNGLDPVTAEGRIATSARLYSAPLLLSGPTELRAQRLAGTNWTVPSSAFFLPTTSMAPPTSLVVTEIHYHPLNNAAEEFLELQNSSRQFPLVAGGARVSGGTDAVLPNGLLLDPGERVVLVQDRSAFANRYGGAIPISGGLVGQLSNGGDLIHLLSPSGQVLQRFSYSSQPPWPSVPAGGGTSLTLVHSTSVLDPAVPQHWRSSLTLGGTPGWDDGVAFQGDPSADEDRDGVSALTEYYLGSSDHDPGSGPDESPILTRESDGTWIVSAAHALNADQVEAWWESSLDLEHWGVAQNLEELPAAVGPERSRLRWRLTGDGPRRLFLRLRLRLR